ncbi:nucleoside hydrolase [Herbiconiux moechotypicola]|uniref:Nucleoside hydrolase n=1 Tax=Herbiconiux moechotypicola TaxID=637393 RepID=A0ABN3E6R1_9MICO|nr:nucleoside hydrolase [Herbiconiux moechotypicola]MCS5731998.1 nucleoside hydrolase [Herbiconiux moechotypicola]
MKVLLDTDLALGERGSEIDDGVAFAMAAASDAVDLVAVTTVNGNTHVETATALAASLGRTLGLDDVPIYAGAEHPLVLPRHQLGPAQLSGEQRDEFHRIKKERASAASAIVDHVHRFPDELTIVAIGPLTNLALALRLDPSIAEKIANVFVMGGYYFGQTNRMDLPGEFNVWADPHSFDAVLTSGAPLSLVGIDVTSKVTLSREDAASLSAGGPVARLVGEHALAWIDHLNAEQPNAATPIDSCVMHDPLAMVAAISEDVLIWKDAYVRAESSSELTRGVTIADFLSSANPPPANARVAVEVDTGAFSEFWDALFLGHDRA